MKYLTVCQGALLALSLAVVSTSAFAGDYQAGGYGGQRDCYKCPPPRNYDTQEVVKQTKDVDHSRVIETQSVVPSKRVIETNHLIIQENETRNIGTVQHNHTIIEKELVLTKRNVDTKVSTPSSISSSTSTTRSGSASSRSARSPASTAISASATAKARFVPMAWRKSPMLTARLRST